MAKIVRCLAIFITCFISSKMQASNFLAKYEKYADQIMNIFADDMEKKFKIYCTVSGGRMPHNVEASKMGFVAYRPVSLQEARKLEIQVTEELVDKINASKKIRPFLKEYPFTRKRVGIFIAFRNKDGSSFSQDSIAFVIHAKDHIYYSKNDPWTDQYVDFYEESYDEAVKILRENPS